MAVVEAPTKWRVCSGHLTVAFSRVLHCPQDRGGHNVHKAKHRPTPTRYSGDQSWTEISNANFIRIVPSSTRILYIVPRTGEFTTYTKLNRGQCRPLRSSRLRQQIVVARTERASSTEDDGYHRRRPVGLLHLDCCRARSGAETYLVRLHVVRSRVVSLPVLGTI